jgi:hypothetical protein
MRFSAVRLGHSLLGFRLRDALLGRLAGCVAGVSGWAMRCWAVLRDALLGRDCWVVLLHRALL